MMFWIASCLLNVLEVTSMWEPLMIYNALETTGNGMSPRKAWKSPPSDIGNQTITESTLHFIGGKNPYVSSRISEWNSSKPQMIRIHAVNLTQDRFLHTDSAVSLENITINTSSSNSADFKDWMRSDNLHNRKTENASITMSTSKNPMDGTVFAYTYVGYLYKGIVLLWDAKEDLFPALLLCSRDNEIQQASDIRYSLNTHTAVFFFPEYMDADKEVNTTISPERPPPITCLEQKVGVSGRMHKMMYKVERGIRLQTIASSDSSIIISYTRRKDEEILQWNLTANAFNPSLDIEFITVSGSLLLKTLQLNMTYTYLSPYAVAEFLVIEGYYPSVNGSATTTSDLNLMGSGNYSANALTSSTNVTLSTTAKPSTIASTSSTTTPSTPLSAANRLPILQEDTIISDSAITSISTSTGYSESVPSTDTFTPSSSGPTQMPATVLTIGRLDETSTTEMTSTATPAGAIIDTSESCIGSCLCPATNWGSAEELQDLEPETLKILLTWLSGIKKELTVNKTTLSAYKAKKFSAGDERTSSRSIGSFGILIIVSVVLMLILMDLSSLLPSSRQR